MTAQIQDKVMYENHEYVIVGVKGKPLPTPHDFDMTPMMINTACYRGYYAGYVAEDERLYLNSLSLRERTDAYLLINGQCGEWDESNHLQRYKCLSVPTTFSGQLLLGRDFIGSMYVHMGFQEPLSYRHVVELWLHNGNIIDAFDLSIKVTQMREEHYDHARRGQPLDIYHRPLDVDDIADWVNRMFSLDYDI